MSIHLQHNPFEDTKSSCCTWCVNWNSQQNQPVLWSIRTFLLLPVFCSAQKDLHEFPSLHCHCDLTSWVCKLASFYCSAEAHTAVFSNKHTRIHYSRFHMPNAGEHTSTSVKAGQYSWWLSQAETADCCLNRGSVWLISPFSALHLWAAAVKIEMKRLWLCHQAKKIFTVEFSFLISNSGPHKCNAPGFHISVLFSYHLPYLFLSAVMPRFAEQVEVAIEALSTNPPQAFEENEFIDASRLVYDGVRDIRKAVLMIRVCPLSPLREPKENTETPSRNK